MGSVLSVPERPAVPEGKTRICVAGFGVSHNSGMAQKLARKIYDLHSDQYEAFFYFESMDFKNFLGKVKAEEGWVESSFEKTAPEGVKTCTNFKDHGSSPLVWLELPGGKKEYIGGRDFFCDWAGKKFKDEKEIVELAGGDTPFAEPSFGDIWFDNKAQVLSGPAPALAKPE